jgi:hypothetical protein
VAQQAVGTTAAKSKYKPSPQGAVESLSRQVRRWFKASLPERPAELPWKADSSRPAENFPAWLRLLFRKDWVVYAKPPFGGPEYVLRYLGRYTHRVAISNHRLVSFNEGKVTFRWRDSVHNNEQKLLTLSLDEFLRRFLLHLLPKGFVSFATAVSWPTANEPLSLRFVFSCSGQHRNRAPSKIPLPRTIFGAVQNVAGQW